jgi:thioredoxin 1
MTQARAMLGSYAEPVCGMVVRKVMIAKGGIQMTKRIVGMLVAGGVLFVTGCEKKTSPVEKAGASSAEKDASRVVELNDTTFAAQTAQGVVLVDFWAPWCGPCRMQGPIVEKAAEQLGDAVKVAKVNVDQAPQTSQKFGISSIPTLIVFNNGKLVKQFVGVTQADDLVAAIKAAK